MTDYYVYWGKAKRADDEQLVYHLLVYHCLDVRAVGELLIDNYLKRKKLSLGDHGISKTFLKRIFLFFLVLHDIGKFSETFQNLRSDILTYLQNVCSNKKYKERHDQLGWIAYDCLLRDLMISRMEEFGLTDEHFELFDIFSLIAFGHHGKPPIEAINSIRRHFEDNNIQAVKQFSELFLNEFISYCSENLRHISSLSKDQFKSLKSLLKHLSWELAGLTVIADWIASGDSFPYENQKIALKDYLQSSEKIAEEAVLKAGIVPSLPSKKCGLSQVFPDFAETPTPLQKFCDELILINKPQLWILEDVTGAGKTEASLTLASRMITSGLADGVFIALPTMATSNAMYERMGGVYYRLFNENEKPSLVLSHGARHLSEKFRQSYRDQIIEINTDTVLSTDDIDEGRVHCSEWLANSSKKALLADTGVGTIDQVLLSVLPVRYQSLRYFGMSRKVLIFDEVHSYDSYMLCILETVLQGHASAGGSAILLSATLPFSIRERFALAYKKGLGVESESVSLHQRDYPLATGIIKDGKVVEKPIDTRKEVNRKVAVSFIENIDSAVSIIASAVEKGQCICWIRNTVNDVMDAYDILAFKKIVAEGKIDVFHSRFALKDRIEIEKRVISFFGKDSGHYERNGRVLLATQVVEQSLDLDFDVLISDLAPIDLIIQRAGRLQRHLRDHRGNRVPEIEQSTRPSPIMYVCIPPDTDTPKETWFSNSFKGASFVYNDHALIWRTKEILKREGAIIMPSGARLLIESVYGEEKLKTPDIFFSSEGKASEERRMKEDMADYNTLNIDRGYCSLSNMRWDEEERVPTRLSEEQQLIYLFRVENDEIVPLYQGDFAWDMSSMKVQKYFFKGYDAEGELMQKIKDTKKKFHVSYDALFVKVGDRGDINGQIAYDQKFGLRKFKEVK